MQSKLNVRPAQLGQWIRRGRGGRVLALSLLLAALTAAGMLAGLRGSHAQSSGGGQKPDPDYSRVDDFTNGRKHLLRNDDLVMSFYFNGGGETRNVLFSAGTSNSNAAALRYDQRVIPNGQAGCTDPNNCYFDYHAYDGATPATGRFFNTDRDTTVQYPFQFQTPNAPLLISLAGKSVGSAAGFTWTSAQDISFVIGANSFPSAVGDFNGDGYDDLLMGYSNPSAIPSNPKLRIATAVDPNDPSKGFKFGPEFSISNQYGIRQLEVGDFDGNGLPEIVELYVAANKAVTLATFRVDPATLTISAGGEIVFLAAGDTGAHPFQLVAGRFTTVSHDQLVVGSQLLDGNQIHVTFFDFAANSIQPQRVSSVLFPDSGYGIVLSLKAGRFNWSSPYDQIAWMSSDGATGTRVSVLTVDPQSLTVVRQGDIPSISDPGGARFIGMSMAVGNFDNMQPSAADPTKTERNPDLQIAVVGARANISNAPGQTGTAALFIYNVSADYTTLTQASSVVLNESFFGGNNIIGMSIAASDMRGRSFRLGAGYKITVDRVQPQVVLAMPPMHADYVSPRSGQMPTVLNLSVVPDNFKSAYEQTESTDASVTQTDTTSSSFSGEEKISGSFAIGEAGSDGEIESGVEIKDSFTAKQEIKNSNDHINGAFNSFDVDVSQATGLSDVVWFKDTSYFLWVYPVIGQTVCSADKADKDGKCADSDRVPMQIMFSAPQATTVQRLAADTLEWYQPPWEYGNLLSYPAGLAQLKQYLPDIQLLTADTTVFATDDAAATLKTTWANGRNTGQNIEQEQLFSEDNDLSVEGKVGGEGFGFAVKASAGLELNFGGSDGTKSLNVSDTKFSSARGITVTKSASFTDPFNYKYFFSPYIFGKMKPVGYTDPINSTADLLAFGALRSAYTVNPIGTTATNAGAWWSQSPYRQFPDVALNHPVRWSYGAQGKPSNGIIPSNCVGIDNFSMDCVTPTERDPDNPWSDPFHDMRGLFITNALNPPPTTSNPFVPGNGGAQLETATAGDQLTLSARVYNYSFKAMPAGSQVKVRFYGMEWNTEVNYPADATFDSTGKLTDPGGKSFQIGNDVKLNPIAPFNNEPNAPLNWVLASTTFDTTGRANQALAFWVAVWIEDANGKLVQELPSHGLTGIPASSQTATFDAITRLEELVSNPLKQSDDDPAQVSFSNNIGFYRSIFHILAKTPALTATRAAASVKVEKVEVSGTWLKPGRSVEGSVTLRNGAQELFGVMVYFYDGDPAAGGKLIDVERVARLRANGRQQVSIRFRPQVCGAHQLFVRVDPGEAHATSGQASQAVQVECPTPVCVAQVCLRSAQYYALNLNRLPHGMVSILGGGLNQQVSTSDTKRLGLLLQGGVSRQQQLNQQFVATQLSLLAQAGGSQTTLQSNLLCYKLNFQPVELSNGQTLSPSMTLGELFAQVRQAGQSGNAIDQRQLTNLLELLNGNDPMGRCW